MTDRDSVVTIDPTGDPQLLLERLAAGVARALPAAAPDAVLEVERARSLGDRLAGRPGDPVALRLEGRDETLTLRLDRGRLAGEVARVSGGVVIGRRPMSLGQWLVVLEARIASLAADAAGDTAAAARALGALGLHPPVDDLVVDRGDPIRGLGVFEGRVRGLLPPESTALVERIVLLLREALPRVDGDAGQLVRRAATVYLPDTVRAYAALPADWASTHTLLDGRTPADALHAQLTDLAEAAERMRDAAVSDDANALLLNGMFLEDRFRG